MFEKILYICFYDKNLKAQQEIQNTVWSLKQEKLKLSYTLDHFANIDIPYNDHTTSILLNKFISENLIPNSIIYIDLNTNASGINLLTINALLINSFEEHLFQLTNIKIVFLNTTSKIALLGLIKTFHVKFPPNKAMAVGKCLAEGEIKKLYAHNFDFCPKIESKPIEILNNNPWETIQIRNNQLQALIATVYRNIVKIPKGLGVANEFKKLMKLMNFSYGKLIHCQSKYSTFSYYRDMSEIKSLECHFLNNLFNYPNTVYWEYIFSGFEVYFAEKKVENIRSDILKELPQRLIKIMNEGIIEYFNVTNHFSTKQIERFNEHNVFYYSALKKRTYPIYPVNITEDIVKEFDETFTSHGSNSGCFVWERTLRNSNIRVFQKIGNKLEVQKMVVAWNEWYSHVDKTYAIAIHSENEIDGYFALFPKIQYVNQFPYYCMMNTPFFKKLEKKLEHEFEKKTGRKFPDIHPRNIAYDENGKIYMYDIPWQ